MLNSFPELCWTDQSAQLRFTSVMSCITLVHCLLLNFASKLQLPKNSTPICHKPYLLISNNFSGLLFRAGEELSMQRNLFTRLVRQVSIFCILLTCWCKSSWRRRRRWRGRWRCRRWRRNKANSRTWRSNTFSSGLWLADW